MFSPNHEAVSTFLILSYSGLPDTVYAKGKIVGVRWLRLMISSAVLAKGASVGENIIRQIALHTATALIYVWIQTKAEP